MPDPCQEFVDAVAESEYQIQLLLEQLDGQLMLLDERLAALATCRDENPGSGGPEGFTANHGKLVTGKERVAELKKLFPKKK